MGRPEPPQRSPLFQGLGFMGDQMLQYSQKPGPVVRQIGIEVLDVVAYRYGAAHRNNPRRPGARAGWIFPRVVCMPEGKNRALTVIQRSRQALVSLGPLIQLGSSQLPTKAREKRIWPVRRPLEAAAVASRVKGGMGRKEWRSFALATNQPELMVHQPGTAICGAGW